MVREDLTADFHAMAESHTKAIGRLLEINDDHLLLMLDTKLALNDITLQQTEVVEATTTTLPNNLHETPTNTG